MCRHRFTEVFFLLGCADRVCCLAALRTVEGFLLFLGRKALNLRKAGSAWPSAYATAVANHSSARAVGSSLLLLLLERPSLQQRLSLFLAVRSQACPGCHASAARAPRDGRDKSRCHAEPPHPRARRSAAVLASGKPGAPGCPRVDGLFVI